MKVGIKVTYCNNCGDWEEGIVTRILEHNMLEISVLSGLKVLHKSAVKKVK